MIQWCTHHKDDPPPPEDDENKEKRTDDIPVWDQEFLKVDQGTLFELILVCKAACVFIVMVLYGTELSRRSDFMEGKQSQCILVLENVG